MKALIFLPVGISLILTVLCLQEYADRRRDPKWKTAVQTPFYAAVIGQLVYVLLIPAVVLVLRGQFLGGWIFASICLLCWPLELAYLNSAVFYDNTGFTHRDLFGISRSYSYTQITRIRQGMATFGPAASGRDTVLYCGKHRIRIDVICLNRNNFLGMAARKSRISVDLRGTVTTQRKTFLGITPRVEGFWKNVIVLAICTVLFIGMDLFATVTVLLPADSDETTEGVTAVLTDWSTSRTNLTLIAEDGTAYVVDYYHGLELDPDALCDGRTEYRLRIKGTESLWVEAMDLPNGTPVFTYEEKRQAYRESQYPGLAGLYLFALLSLAAVILAIRIGTEPDRFSPALRWVFFRV